MKRKIIENIVDKYNKISNVDFTFYRPKKSALLSCFVVFFILYVFEPFGLHTLNNLWLLFVSVFFSTIPAVIYLLVFKTLFKFLLRFENSWTFKKEIPFFSFLIFMSGFVIYGYILIICSLFPKHFIYREELFSLSFYYAFSIGVVIYLVIKLFDTITYYKTKIRKEQNTPGVEKIVFKSKDKNERIITIDPSLILFFESNKNRVNIFFFGNENIESEDIKMTLKEIEMLLEKHDYFFRCHKSYIINKFLITNIEGNSRKSIAVIGTKFKIPISRNKFLELKKYFS